MITQVGLAEVAQSILQENIDPAPRLLLLRDFLCLSPDHPDVVSAKRELLASRQVQSILSLQHEDGSFGYFHSLSNPTPQQPMTTEQALRRLLILGLDASDGPVGRIAGYLERALTGETKPPDRVEKTHTWSIYMPLMLSAWLRRLGSGSAAARAVAGQWAGVAGHAFSGESYSHTLYLEAYQETFSILPHPKAGRLQDFVHFYVLTLLKGMLEPQTEKKLLEYVLGHEAGIYYVYDRVPGVPPEDFRSRQAVRYLSALELLSGFGGAVERLGFAAEWLMENRGEDGLWDLGADAKDGVHFPLSLSWRDERARKTDCTAGILALLRKLPVSLPPQVSAPAASPSAATSP